MGVRRIIAFSVGGVTGVMLALVVLLYTAPGLSLVGRIANSLAGGAVRITGLSGTSPNHLRADRLEVIDVEGVWLTLDNVVLDWSALSMLSNHVAIEKVAAARVLVLRRPISSRTSNGSTPRIDIAALQLPRIEIGAAVIGHAARLSLRGALHYVSRHDLNANLLVTRVGNADRYRIVGGITADVAHGSAVVNEGADGVLAKLAGLPGLGPVNLSAQASGDAGANQIRFTLSAGALRGEGEGAISLASQRADVDMHLAAPQMTLRPDLAWHALSGEAHMHGGFRTPNISAHLGVDQALLGGVSAHRVLLDVRGERGTARLDGRIEGVSLPPGYDVLLGKAPVTIAAKADLKAPKLPVNFTVSHVVAQLSGTARLRGGTYIDATLKVPSLVPFAALEKVDLQGSAAFHLTLQQQATKARIALDGKLDARGTALLARILGQKASLALNATLDGADVIQSRVQMQGAGFASDVKGTFRKGFMRYRLSLHLPDLSRLARTLSGTAELTGTVTGAMGKALLTGSGSASMATKGFAPERIAIRLEARDLPSFTHARLTADGRLNKAPLRLHATLDGEKTKKLVVDGSWRSLAAKGNLSVAQSLLSGTVRIALGQLGDVAVLTGQPMQGAANLAATLTPQGSRTNALFVAELRDMAAAGVSVHSATLHGAASNLFAKPVLGFAASATGITAQGVSGNAAGQVRGPLDKLVVTVSASMKDITGAPLSAKAAAVLHLAAKQLTLASLDSTWRGVPLKLKAPAHVDFAAGLSFDRIAASLGHGNLTASGRLLPQLALNASASGIALQDFSAFLPQQLQGTVSAEANLHGTIAAPIGQVRVTGRQLRSAFAGRAVPAATLEGEAQLMGDRASLKVALAAATSARLVVDGTAPLSPGAALALHVVGNADLALLDPILAADGRRARGQLAADIRITGTMGTPRFAGGGNLANGEIQDYARGLRLQDITATMTADGGRINLTKLTAHAGNGTITGNGSMDLKGSGTPVQIALHAENARPIVSDLVTATVSGDVRLSGALKTSSKISGRLQVTEGEINLPERFPPEVAVLNVRRRGEKPLPPPAPPSRMGLDLQLSTTGPVYVRGHGLDAEMRGEIEIHGTTAAPEFGGGLRMNRGRFTVAGQTLDFTTGRISLTGTGVRRRLDPTLDFVAQTVSGGVTATLSVTGYASSPKIALSSTPQLPQDEIAAHLLFQQSTKQLTPLQLVSLAQGLAAMGGLGGGFNPLGVVRNTLGLDRLSVGSTQGAAAGNQSQTTVEAGRYVAKNVYVGVKQNLSGGTQTQVQLDITRRLKAQATINTSATTTPAQGNALQDHGNSVGLSYQFEY